MTFGQIRVYVKYWAEQSATKTPAAQSDGNFIDTEIFNTVSGIKRIAKGTPQG